MCYVDFAISGLGLPIADGKWYLFACLFPLNKQFFHGDSYQSGTLD